MWQACLSSTLDRWNHASETAPERCVIQQCTEELSDYTSLPCTTNDIGDDDELTALHSRLEKSLFDVSQRVKHLSNTPMPESTSASAFIPDSTGVRFPELQPHPLEAILGPVQRSCLDAEKTVYLQSPIKDGATRNAIESLSHSGDDTTDSVITTS